MTLPEGGHPEIVGWTNTEPSSRLAMTANSASPTGLIRSTRHGQRWVRAR